METEKFIVIDFAVQDVDIHLYDISTSFFEVETEDLLKKLGHNPDTCYYLFGTDVNVINHKEIIDND